MNENENVTDTVEESDLASESDWKPTSGMYHRSLYTAYSLRRLFLTQRIFASTSQIITIHFEKTTNFGQVAVFRLPHPLYP
jgi:hypothetical protein